MAGTFRENQFPFTKQKNREKTVLKTQKSQPLSKTRDELRPPLHCPLQILKQTKGLIFKFFIIYNGLWIYDSLSCEDYAFAYAVANNHKARGFMGRHESLKWFSVVTWQDLIGGLRNLQWRQWREPKPVGAAGGGIWQN